MRLKLTNEVDSPEDGSAVVDESSTEPASFMLVDRDGNPVLIDQHV